MSPSTFAAARFDRRRHLASWIALVVVTIGPWPSLLEGVDYFVAVDHPAAADSNPGLSPERPYRTLSRAVQGLAPGDVLHIASGIYREPLIIENSGTAENPIVVTGENVGQGTVVIRGSDVVTGWMNDGGNRWSVSWEPLQPIAFPVGWPDYGAYSRRRELIFVDGKPLVQVMSPVQLEDGRFWMDDGARRLRIQIQGDPNQLRVEIAVRRKGVQATGSYHVFRALTVEHVTSDIWIAAMHLGTHQRIEDCTIEHNNGDGIKAFSDTVITHTTSSFNGRLGIALNGSGSRLTSNETSHNSWRYGPRWEAGGIKILGGSPSDNRIMRHTAVSNNGIGIWFDTCGPGNLVTASLLKDNVFAGIEFEATAGPNRATNNIILDTRKAQSDGGIAIDGAGIIVYDSNRVELYNNTIVGVLGPGIAIAGNGSDRALYSSETKVLNNIIVSTGRAAVSFEWLAGEAREKPRVESHTFDYNLYSSNPTTIVFPQFGQAFGLEFWDLSRWQQHQQQDLNSVRAPPGFLGPADGNYALQPTSAAIDSGLNLDTVVEDILGTPRPQGPRTDIGAFESVQPPVDSIQPPQPEDRSHENNASEPATLETSTTPPVADY